jgi:ribosomal protein S18 acetylase RimI-like enzyme
MGGALTVGVLTLGAVQVYQAGELLAAAFHREPVSVWLQPDPVSRAGTLTWKFARYTAEAMVTGTVDLLYPGSHGHRPCCQHAGEEPIAAAVWFDHTMTTALDHLGYRDDDGPRDSGSGERYDVRWGVFQQALTTVHPKVAHAHLLLMGVHPDQQDNGLGSRLLAQRLDQLDAEDTPAYLESTSQASRALYARHGFRDHGPAIHLPQGPTVWPMWRTPRHQHDKRGAQPVAVPSADGRADGTP